MPAHPERRRLAQHQLCELVPVRFGAQHAQQHAGPALLHLDGRVKHVERTQGHRLLYERAEQFGVRVVQIGLQDTDEVGFPIVSRRVGGFAEDGPQDVRPRLVLARAEAVADFVRSQVAHRAEALRQFRQQRRAGRRHQFVPLFAL